MELVTTHDMQYVVTNGAVIEPDTFAVIEQTTGKIVTTPVYSFGSGTSLSSVGIHTESMTGDGVATASVRLGKTVLADNSVGDPLDNTHIGALCYVEGPNTVRAAGYSIAGTVVGFVGTKVLVKCVL